MDLKQIILRWLPTFLAFPIGGQLVVWLIGPVQDTLDAILGGAIVGITLGLFQFWALRPLKVSLSWLWGSAVGLTVGSPIAWTLINYQTTIGALTLWGFVAGAILGISQAAFIRLAISKILIWAAAVSLTWGLAWFISANVIVDVEAQYAVFGSTGAIVATALLGLVLNLSLKKK